MMNLITRLLRKRQTLNGMRIDRCAKSTPVIRYVNMILYQMHEHGTMSRALRKSEPLPDISEFGDDLCAPPLDAVVNRLKVMSAKNPVVYPEPIEGEFQVQVGGAEHRVRCTFNDNADERCTLTMKKREDAQQIGAR